MAEHGLPVEGYVLVQTEQGYFVGKNQNKRLEFEAIGAEQAEASLAQIANGRLQTADQLYNDKRRFGMGSAMNKSEIFKSALEMGEECSGTWTFGAKSYKLENAFSPTVYTSAYPFHRFLYSQDKRASKDGNACVAVSILNAYIFFQGGSAPQREKAIYYRMARHLHQKISHGDWGRSFRTRRERAEDGRIDADFLGEATLPGAKFHTLYDGSNHAFRDKEAALQKIEEALQKGQGVMAGIFNFTSYEIAIVGVTLDKRLQFIDTVSGTSGTISMEETLMVHAVEFAAPREFEKWLAH